MDQPIANQPIKSVGAPARDADRDSLLLKAVLRFETIKDDIEVRIRNLSAGGLMAEAPLRVARGEKVEISLRNIGWISGTVAWVAEGRLGIAFDHTIDPKVVRNPVGQSQSDLPNYLKKLNEQQANTVSNLRRV
jgi:hypothetical protein